MFILVFFPFTGCVFGTCGGTPEVIYCSSDNDCIDDMVCNAWQHICQDPSSPQGAPEIQSAEIAPASLSQGNVTLTISSNRELDASRVDLEQAASSQPLPAFSVRAEGSVLSIDFLVGEADPEGVYAFRNISLADTTGNVMLLNQTFSFVVDRGSPVISNLRVTLVESGVEELFADIDPHAKVDVTFSIDDLEATYDLSIGSIPISELSSVPCEILSGGRHVCQADLGQGDFPDGDLTVAVIASDSASNQELRSITIPADTKPPSIVEGSLQLTYLDSNGVVTNSLRTNGAADIRFLVDEPLGVTPIAKLQVGVEQFDVDASVVGNTVSLSVQLPEVLPEGIYPVSVVLEDRVGHSNIIDVLPIGDGENLGISVNGAIASPCPAPPGLDCVDADGDGIPLFSSTCPTGSDCNDIESTVYPGAPELPGDGFVNDCSAGGVDAPIDETTGTFADNIYGTVTDTLDFTAGTKDNPFRFASDAMIAARLRGLAWVFLATNNTFNAPFSSDDINLLGGLDSTWTRTTGRSRFVLQVDRIIKNSNGKRIVIDGINIVSSTPEMRTLIVDTSAPIHFIRSNLDNVNLNRTSPAYFISSRWGFDAFGNGVFNVSAPTVFIDSEVGQLYGNHDVRFVRSIAHGYSRLNGDARLLSVASLFKDRLVQETDRTELYFSSIRSDIVHSASLLISDTEQLKMYGVSLINRAACTALRVDLDDAAGDSISIAASNFYAPSGTLFGDTTNGCVGFLGDTLEAGELDSALCDAAEWDFCAVENNNSSYETFSLPLLPDAEDPQSGLRDRVTAPLPDGIIPGSIILDYEGDCRYGDGVPDIGHDEI